MTKLESNLLEAIANRAVSVAARAGLAYDKRDALMDLTACHANGCPLRLAELQEADQQDFSHDVFGIRRHLNRATGRLENCFLPRYARKEAP